MLHTKICVTSQEAVGCTFIDWSIHFLSGQTTFFNADDNQWIELTSDPLTQHNAHNHKKNHPRGRIETGKVLDKFDKHATGVFTVYPQLLDIRLQLFYIHARKTATPISNQIPETLNFTLDKNNHNLDENKKILEYQEQDYVELFNMCAQRNTKIIYVDSNPEIDLYYTTRRFRGNLLFGNNKSGAQSTELTTTTEFEEYFFGQSIAAYSELTDIWDVRERRALNLRPLQRKHAALDFGLPHLWIDARSFWTLGESYMRKILTYVDLPVDPDRLNQWLPIYTKWQNIQLTHLDFCYTLPHMIDSIVNNWDYNLGNLTFEQEIVIQHFLIYKHNLNLKTWQLSKFPDNAKDLHALLEPNIHQVESIY
jgi:hypothetical protein